MLKSFEHMNEKSNYSPIFHVEHLAIDSRPIWNGEMWLSTLFIINSNEIICKLEIECGLLMLYLVENLGFF